MIIDVVLRLTLHRSQQTLRFTPFVHNTVSRIATSAFYHNSLTQRATRIFNKKSDDLQYNSYRNFHNVMLHRSES